MAEKLLDSAKWYILGDGTIQKGILVRLVVPTAPSIAASRLALEMSTPRYCQSKEKSVLAYRSSDKVFIIEK